MEYTIIMATNYIQLIKIVNKKIAEGWTPLGGVAFGKEIVGLCIFQAMIKQ